MSAIRHAFKRSTIYFSRYGKVSAICCKCQHQQQRQFTGLPLTQLSEEELMIKDSAARFSKEKIAPLSRQMEESREVPQDLMNEIAKLGWFGYRIPIEYDGVGGDLFSFLLIAEEVSKVDPTFATIFGYQNTLAIPILTQYGNEEQKQKYLPKIAAGMFASVCLSESESGSDAFALQTRAVRDGDDYIINGSKLWITYAHRAGVFLVMANAAPEKGYKGITCFIVDAGTPGLSVPRKEEKLGMHLASNCPVTFDNVRVPGSNIVGEIGSGYKMMAHALIDGRIGVAIQAVGGAQGVLDYAVGYAMERKQFGKRLFDFQAMQHQMAKASVEIEAARLLGYNAGRLMDQKIPSIKEASMAKYYATEVASQVCLQGVKWLGALGYMKSMPVEKFLRDIIATTIYEGASNIQLNTIAAFIKAEHR